MSKNCFLLKTYSEEEKKLDPEQETACRDIVNELYHEMETTFAEYKIPPPFFGPLQVVSYEGIGGDIGDNQDDAEFIANVSDEPHKPTMLQSRAERLARNVNLKEMEK
jgi:DNA-directed RNA polymerase subunit L